MINQTITFNDTIAFDKVPAMNMYAAINTANKSYSVSIDEVNPELCEANRVQVSGRILEFKSTIDAKLTELGMFIL